MPADSYQLKIGNDGAILDMGDLVISYRPKPAFMIGKDNVYVD